jgi:nucleoside-diphosphate-sugar epimerase
MNSPAVQIPLLKDFLRRDLEYICGSLRSEFGRMAGSNLLITGGAGFLGYYLVLAALHYNETAGASKPIRLTVWDNFVRGTPRWLSDLRGNPHLRIETRDLIHPLPEPMDDFQWIIHAAGIASPTYYRRYPIQTIDANINGDPTAEWIPTPEHFRGLVSCTGPRACYDESKRFGETLCVVFAQQHGIPVKMARPFNNYGPGLKITDRRVIPDFVRDVLAGRDIVMYSDGKPTRTFCYSADSITGYYKVLVNGLPGEPYNIGIDRPEISMAELAERIIREARSLLGYQGQLVRHPSPEADYLVDNPNRRCPNLDKSRTQLGYAPTILVDEGIRRTLEWYHHNREAEEA